MNRSRRSSLAARVAALVFTAAAMSSGCGGDPEAEARTHAANGDAYASRGQLKEAIIEYRNALKLVPDQAATHFKLARAYSASSDPRRTSRRVRCCSSPASIRRRGRWPSGRCAPTAGTRRRSSCSATRSRA
jgi:tetratricopeptide (TPR) repeat protein